MEVVFSWERLITTYETSHCHRVEDHSLNFPSFYILHVALSISVYVCFRTWNENHVILINCNVCHATMLSFLKETCTSTFLTHKERVPTVIILCTWQFTVFICSWISSCLFLSESNLFIPVGSSQFKPILEVMWLSLMNSAHLFDSEHINR